MKRIPEGGIFPFATPSSGFIEPLATPTSTKSDQELWKLFTDKNDDSAFEELYARNKSMTFEAMSWEVGRAVTEVCACSFHDADLNTVECLERAFKRKVAEDYNDAFWSSLIIELSTKVQGFPDSQHLVRRAKAFARLKFARKSKRTRVAEELGTITRDGYEPEPELLELIGAGMPVLTRIGLPEIYDLVTTNPDLIQRPISYDPLYESHSIQI